MLRWKNVRSMCAKVFLIEKKRMRHTQGHLSERKVCYRGASIYVCGRNVYAKDLLTECVFLPFIFKALTFYGSLFIYSFYSSEPKMFLYSFSLSMLHRIAL